MFSFLTPWVKRLIAANVAVFLAQLAFPSLTDHLVFYRDGALTQPWTFVTYMFAHDPGGVWHILFNMLTLGFFGPRVEAQIGGKHFISLYMISGITGALVWMFASPNPVLGASGAVFGVELAFAMYWPRERIYIWGIVPLEARVMVVALTVYSLWAGMGTFGGGVAHFAHLGGYLGAFLYLKILDVRSPRAAYQRKLRAATFGKQGLGLVEHDSGEIARWEAIPRAGLHAMNLEELDRVIAKARREGVRKLTPDERAFLHRMALRGAPTEASGGPPVS